MVDIKMYMSEISKFKISDLKAQKMIILWTMKHVSAIRKHPVFIQDHECLSVDSNVTVSETIVGAFDLLTNVTKDTGTLFEEFEDGFNLIIPDNSTDEEDFDEPGFIIYKV